MKKTAIVSLFFVLAASVSAGDWPTVHHDVARSGCTADEVRPPYVKRWARFFPLEIMTTAMEPIVADGRVFVGTYSGNLYALDAATGKTLWKFSAGGPILHSPAVAGGAVFFGSADGWVRALDASTGRLLWRSPPKGAEGGFCTSPAVFKGAVYIGARNGVFYALDAATGAVRWSLATGGPIRTTAACTDGRIVFASDDMHAYCADETGRLLWRSAKLNGQSLRDYYPVIIGKRVVFRTNPAGLFSARIGADRHLLATNAGVPDHWRDIESFTRSGRTRGTPAQLEAERRVVLAHLEKDPDARTFFALDIATGKQGARMPVLWVSGCQGVASPPVLTNGGRAIVFYRSAYSNWNHGVAPLVAIGYLDFQRSAVEPIRHTSGNRPPWNTFWGTADESQNFTVGGRILYICHQDTLSGLDLETRRLFHIAGTRDTWGGEHGLPWARNEWHGPARGAAAVCGNRIYWVTGSRVICIEGGTRSGKPADKPFSEPPTSASLGLKIPAAPKPVPEPQALEKYVWRIPRPPKRAETDAVLVARLERSVADLLDSGPFAPLYVQPGLAKHEYFFDSSGDAIYALSLAYPHLSSALKRRVREYLSAEIENYPPWSPACFYPIRRGKRRELFDIPVALLRPSPHRRPHPIGNLYALWLYTERTGDRSVVERNWAAIRSCYADFIASGWKPQSEKCDIFTNRYAAGLIGYARLARGRDDASSREAAHLAARAIAAQLHIYHKSLRSLVLPSIRSVKQIDSAVGRGRDLYCGAHHFAKISKFLDLQPETAAAIRDNAPEAARVFLRLADVMMPGWYLAWGERQIHFGENFVDYPDQALSIFRAKALIERPGRRVLLRYLDIPWCPGDLYYIEKLVRILESS